MLEIILIHLQGHVYVYWPHPWPLKLSVFYIEKIRKPGNEATIINARFEFTSMKYFMTQIFGQWTIFNNRL